MPQLTDPASVDRVGRGGAGKRECAAGGGQIGADVQTRMDHTIPHGLVHCVGESRPFSPLGRRCRPPPEGSSPSPFLGRCDAVCHTHTPESVPCVREGDDERRQWKMMTPYPRSLIPVFRGWLGDPVHKRRIGHTNKTKQYKNGYFFCFR